MPLTLTRTDLIRSANFINGTWTNTATARLAAAEAANDFPRLAGALYDNGRLWTRLAADVADLAVVQQEAVALWYAHGCEGIVEAVTGTGKTHLGLEAVAHAARAGERSTVLVPTSIVSQSPRSRWVSRRAARLETQRLVPSAAALRPSREWRALWHGCDHEELACSGGGGNPHRRSQSATRPQPVAG